MLAELHHPCIVEYIHHGRTPTGELYLAMEWLDGEDLRQRLRRAAPLAVDETLALGSRVASALAVAHARRVVHRDITPAKFFLRGGDVRQVKILDFGIARGDERDAAEITRDGIMIGTPRYMAPEQVESAHDVDPAPTSTRWAPCSSTA